MISILITSHSSNTLVTVHSQAPFGTPLATFDVGDPFSSTLSQITSVCCTNSSCVYTVPQFRRTSIWVSECLRLPGVSKSVLYYPVCLLIVYDLAEVWECLVYLRVPELSESVWWVSLRLMSLRLPDVCKRVWCFCGWHVSEIGVSSGDWCVGDWCIGDCLLCLQIYVSEIDVSSGVWRVGDRLISLQVPDMSEIDVPAGVWCVGDCLMYRRLYYVSPVSDVSEIVCRCLMCRKLPDVSAGIWYVGDWCVCRCLMCRRLMCLQVSHVSEIVWCVCRCLMCRKLSDVSENVTSNFLILVCSLATSFISILIIIIAYEASE